MKLIVDMNLSPDWVSALESKGFDAIHWTRVGPIEASDDEIMAWARANKAIVLTRDLDFAAALQLQRRALPSVIQLRIDRVRPDRHLPLVQRALSLHGEHLEQGGIVTIEKDRIRGRVLDADTGPDFSD